MPFTATDIDVREFNALRDELLAAVTDQRAAFGHRENQRIATERYLAARWNLRVYIAGCIDGHDHFSPRPDER